MLKLDPQGAKPAKHYVFLVVSPISRNLVFSLFTHFGCNNSIDLLTVGSHQMSPPYLLRLTRHCEELI